MDSSLIGVMDLRVGGFSSKNEIGLGESPCEDHISEKPTAGLLGVECGGVGNMKGDVVNPSEYVYKSRLF